MPVTGNKLFIDKRLSIRVSTGGFSFSVAGQEQQFTVSGSALSVELREALRKFLALNDDIHSVTLQCDTPCTHIPLNEFRSEEVQSLYKLTFGEDAVPSGWSIRYEVISPLELVEVYCLDTEVEQTVQDFFPEITVHNLQSEVLKAGLEVDKQMPMGKRRMHASVKGEGLLLFTFVDNRLHYCNHFPADEMTTKAYYTLYVWNHLELAQERDILVVHGQNEEYTNQLKNFIRDIICV